MNGAGVSAPTPAAASSSSAAPATTSGVAAANDEVGTGQSFAALLGSAADAGPTGDADVGADPKASTVSSDASDEVKDDKGASAATDTALPDWLQAMRESLSLVGAMFAAPATAEAQPAKLATALPAKPTAAPIATGTSKSVAAAAATADSALLTVLTPDADGNFGLPTDTPAPNADLRFDTMLAVMGDHDAATVPLASTSGLASGALAAMPSAPASTAPAAPPPMTVPPDHPEFAHDLGERIVWITDAGLSSAKIDLHPLDLGRLSVHVQMHGDEAQVSFAADNPATRALLQGSLPQLRELMSVQGLQLLRAQVEQKVGTTRSSDTAFSQARDRNDDGEAGAPVRRVTRLKLVDTYA